MSTTYFFIPFAGNDRARTSPARSSGNACFGVWVAIFALLAGIVAPKTAAQTESVDGTLIFVESFVELSELPLPSSVLVSPDGLHVYVLADRVIGIFTRDPITGRLTLTEIAGDEVGVAHLRSFTISPDGAYLYVAGHDLRVFSRDPVTGKLTLIEIQLEDFWSTGISYVAISPDGAHLYGVGGLNSGYDIIVFARDSASGRLTFVERQEPEAAAKPAKSLTVTPDGKNVYIHNFDVIKNYTRDEETGALGFQGVVTGEPAIFVTVSPDGRHVYAGRDNIAVFARDSATGSLTFVEVIDGIITNLAISDDGEHAYTVRSRRVAVFKRDVTSGSLTFVEEHLGSITPSEEDLLQYPGIVGQREGIDGIVGPLSIALTEDGRHLYTVGYDHSDPEDNFYYEGWYGQLAVFAIQSDMDGDGVVDAMDAFPNLAAETRDSDGDGIGDNFEMNFGLNSDDAGDAALDKDGDGLSNLDEFHRGTEASNPDTDGDGLDDGSEIGVGTDPLNSDSDGDQVSDGIEVAQNRDPLINEAGVIQIINSILLGDD